MYAYGRVGRGNLVLRDSVPDSPLNFRDCLLSSATQRRASTTTADLNKLDIIIPLNGYRTRNDRVYSQDAQWLDAFFNIIFM